MRPCYEAEKQLQPHEQQLLTDEEVYLHTRLTGRMRRSLGPTAAAKVPPIPCNRKPGLTHRRLRATRVPPAYHQLVEVFELRMQTKARLDTPVPQNIAACTEAKSFQQSFRAVDTRSCIRKR